MNVWKIVGQVLAVAAGVIQIASYFVDDINTQNYIKGYFWFIIILVKSAVSFVRDQAARRIVCMPRNRPLGSTGYPYERGGCHKKGPR